MHKRVYKLFRRFLLSFIVQNLKTVLTKYKISDETDEVKQFEALPLSFRNCGILLFSRVSNSPTNQVFLEKLMLWLRSIWFAPVTEGLLYVEDFTTNWFLRTWPYMEFICTCSSIVNWKINIIWQRRLLHMSISVEATGKILHLQFVFHMRLVSFEVLSVVTLLKCKLRNELLGF